MVVEEETEGSLTILNEPSSRCPSWLSQLTTPCATPDLTLLSSLWSAPPLYDSYCLGLDRAGLGEESSDSEDWEWEEEREEDEEWADRACSAPPSRSRKHGQSRRTRRPKSCFPVIIHTSVMP